MYQYYISFSNPEGLDFSERFKSKIKYSLNELYEICETCLLKALKEEKRIRGHALMSTPDFDYFINYLKEFSLNRTFSQQSVCIDLFGKIKNTGLNNFRYKYVGENLDF